MKYLVLCKGKILLKIKERKKKVEHSSLYETNLEIRNKILIQEIKSNKILDETRDNLIYKEGNESIYIIIKNKRKKLKKEKNCKKKKIGVTIEKEKYRQQ